MSGILPNGKQQFIDSNGNPLASGKVYYYIPSTTTFKNTYQDPALIILNSNPIQLDANGQCIAYGSGSYRQQVYDVNNNLIWDQESDAPLSLVDFEVPSGSSYIGYNEGQTGAVNRTVQAKLQEYISVKDFGAKGDGTTDDTAAFNAAILAVALAGGGVIIAPTATYQISGTILLPALVRLDLCNSTLNGASITSSADMFQTAYLNGGTLTTNIGTPLDTKLVFNSSVTNGIIQNCGIAFHIQDFINCCEISNIRFVECKYAIFATAIYYSSFTNLNCTGTSSAYKALTNAAYYFGDGNGLTGTYINICEINSITAGNRILGIELGGSAYALTFKNCSVEQGTNGFLMGGGEAAPLKFDTCYFEGLTGIALNFDETTFGENEITVDNCFFNACGTAIQGILGSNVTRGNIYLSNNNEFRNCTTNYIETDNAYSIGIVYIQPASLFSNGLPIYNSQYTVGAKSVLDYDNILNTGGSIVARTKVTQNTIIPFHAEGDSGDNSYVGGVSFCTTTLSGVSSTATITLNTLIKLREFSSMLVYRIYVSNPTTGVSTNLYGFIFGSQVVQHDGNGKTVTVTADSNGYYQIVFSSFNNSAGTTTINGTLRHI